MLRSIRTRLTLITLLLVALPLLIVSVLLLDRHTEVVSSLSRDRLYLVADKFALELELFFNNEVEQLRLYQAFNDPLTLRGRTALETLLFRSATLTELSIVNADGSEIARSSRTQVITEAELRDLSASPAFREVMNGAEVYYGAIRYDDILRTPVMTFSIPVIDLQTNAIDAVLIATMTFRPFTDMILGLDLQQRTDAYIVSSEDGMVLAHRNPSLALQNAHFTLSTQGQVIRATGLVYEDALLVTFRPETASGALMIVIEQVYGDAFTLVMEMQQVSILIITLALLIVFVLTISLVGQMLVPVQNLVAAAIRIRDGDLSARASVESRDELGTLASTFNGMAEELQALINDLETRITDRTRALQTTNQQLRASEQRYRIISDMSMSFAFSYISYPDGAFELEWVTDAFRRVLGFDLTSRPFDEIYATYVHPDERERFHAIIQSLREEALDQWVEIRMFAQDGAVRHLFAHLKSTPDEQNPRLMRITGAAHDITQVKQYEGALQHERNFLQSVMNTSPNGIAVTDSSGVIVYTNPHIERILGVPQIDIYGKRFNNPAWQIMDFEGRELDEAELPFSRVMMHKKAVFDAELSMKNVRGETVYLSVNAAPIIEDDGEIKQVVFSIIDVSLRMAWQQQLEDALEAEKELNQLRSRFISLVSHELRTPLAIILTSADILARRADDLSPQMLLQRVDKIRRQVERLRHILNDVSFINKTDKVGHELRVLPVDLQTFLRDTRDELVAMMDDAPDCELQFVDVPQPFYADESLLYQIISNLLSNALKYTPVDGHVELRVSGKNEGIELSITDTGIGIPAEDQDRLFESFHRARNVSNIPGTGLGLVIIKRAVDYLGGSITVQSEAGVGTTFVVWLPQMQTITSLEQQPS